MPSAFVHDRPTSSPLTHTLDSSTKGSFKPEDDHHTAPVPPLPFTDLMPGKTADGQDLFPEREGKKDV